MDPKHRDRVAFVRLASGHFERGMKLLHVRSKKTMAVSNPVLFLAADRELAEEAWAGDIIGIPNHGVLQLGGQSTFAGGVTVTVFAMLPVALALINGVFARLEKIVARDKGTVVKSLVMACVPPT